MKRNSGTGRKLTLNEQVRELVAHELQLQPNQIRCDANMETIQQWDSVAHINICLAIQGEFGVEMSTNEMTECTSFLALVALLEKRASKAG
jgi:acyl carrier protein